MKKNVLAFILLLIVLTFAFLILMPYFTSHFMSPQLGKENADDLQKFLREQRVKKETEEKIYLMGKFDPSQRDDFILIPKEYTLDGNTMYLRKEAYEAYLRMKGAADIDHIDLKIVSATRNFDYQKDLWNNKWSGVELVDGLNLSESIPDGLQRFNKILEFSAVPGTSRHHFGADIDINNVNPSYFNGYKGAKEYEWLTKNASLFGFCQTYNKKGPDRPTGYNEEKWHWSYLPISSALTQRYAELIKVEDIRGFLGDEFVPGSDLINNYVLGINPDCI